MSEEIVLALDVGTRKVAGLIAVVTPKEFNIKTAVMEEHQSRSMLDGQIQSIPEVAEVVERVKAKLEKKVGFTLTSAAVAAAGRTLITKKGKIEQEMPSLREINEEDILSLEFSALQSLNASLNKEEKESIKGFIDQYHCVGYSVTNYYLDGSVIGSLTGQRGYKAGVEIIATFLPRIIVDSLLAVLRRTGLEMLSLTLEPIAALNLVVPKDMRRLNLALVDIGAGTSDIALTSRGSVHAYAMVPVAGDEITDYLCENYLLDFMEGEKIKKQLNKKEQVSVKNVLGLEETLKTKDILQSIKPEVGKLADKIAATILELNGKSPQAVFCVGGGSLTPGLTEELALKLGMPEERVQIKGFELLKFISGKKHFTGPELVTPIGIAMTAKNKESLRFINVKFNDRPIQVIDLKRGTVVDAFLAAGIRPQEVHSKPGKSITIELNGNIKTIKGKWGTPAKIRVNKQEAGMDTLIKEGDSIEFSPGTDGEEAAGTIKDVITPLPLKRILFHEKEINLSPILEVNGSPVNLDNPLEDRDKITYREVKTIREALDHLGIVERLNKKTLNFKLNGSINYKEIDSFKVFLNEREAELEDLIETGDHIELVKQNNSLRIKEIIRLNQKEIKITVNDRDIIIPVSHTSVTVNGREASPDEIIKNGDEIETLTRDEDLFLAHILNYLDFNNKRPAGRKKLVMLLNGRKAEFVSPVKDGDRLEIKWL